MASQSPQFQESNDYSKEGNLLLDIGSQVTRKKHLTKINREEIENQE